MTHMESSAPIAKRSRRAGRQSILLGLALAWAFGLGNGGAGEPMAFAVPDTTPTQEVVHTIAELLYILNELDGSAQFGERRWEIEQVVRRHVDYTDMARRSLGHVWSGLDEGQQDEFVGLFVQVIRDALANRMCEYSEQQIDYISEEKIGSFANVATRLSGHKVDMAVEFRLVHQAGQWVLYDAEIDGVSIVDNYRAQFAAIIRDVSYAGLITRMKQRTLLVNFLKKAAHARGARRDRLYGSVFPGLRLLG